MTPSRDIGRLLAIMAALRTPKTGCPWDLEQNFATIAPYTLEEAYEVADAIARDDLDRSQGGIGRSPAPSGLPRPHGRRTGCVRFRRRGRGALLRSSSAGIRMCSVTRARRPRRPSKGCGSASRRRKRQAKAARGGAEQAGALAGVPVALPALTRALKLQAKASKVGFDWNDPRAVLHKIREEADEIEAALDGDAPAPPRKSAICCSPSSILHAICAPTRRPCCGRPIRNSSAASPRSSARWPPRQNAAGRDARRDGRAVGRGQGAGVITSLRLP